MARFAFVIVPGWIIGALMLAGIGINFANVVSRYAFGHALFWAEEIMVFITIWGVFVGMAAIAYNGDHLNMDLFSAQIRGRWKIVLNSFVTAMFVACCIFAMTQSFRVVALFVQTAPVSVSAGVPKAIPHAALLVGFVLMILAILVRIRSYLTGKF